MTIPRATYRLQLHRGFTLRDAQTFIGRPRKVTMYGLKLHDSSQAQALVAEINKEFPEVHAAVQGEFMSQMPDMRNMDGMMSGISLLAILVGGVGVLNTMLMAVFERTREIGVLRALGWRRRAVLKMIMKEALLLGLLGGLTGILVAMGLVYSLRAIPLLGAYLTPTWEWPTFARALGIATALGLLGGLYPALRATRSSTATAN
jgi:putative ABC transport system permease protein